VELTDLYSVFEKLDDLLKFMDSLLALLTKDKVVNLLFKITKDFQSREVDEDGGSSQGEEEKKEDPSYSLLKSRVSVGSSKNMSFKDDIARVELCTMESSVTINPHMIVSSLHLT